MMSYIFKAKHCQHSTKSLECDALVSLYVAPACWCDEGWIVDRSFFLSDIFYELKYFRHKKYLYLLKMYSGGASPT